MTETSVRRIRENRARPCPKGCGLLSLLGQASCARVMHCGVTPEAAYPEGREAMKREPEHYHRPGWVCGVCGQLTPRPPEHTNGSTK